ncbi:hypothetical protein [Williamsia sp. CHRR-6]|uniref:hypothetical protein n=1 Tax=Williamsia sp. CHRR-6 TaxID=2835871 RepID=UPI001BDB3800|nr:hypothetical protein [Williamsia sp. CHRR-6]MBT0565598.1 hypothetical protein [Williamsia sp. CHRR-6]
MFITFLFILAFAALLVLTVRQFQRSRGTGGGLSAAAAAQLREGTLTVTGVSDRPGEGDKNGEVFCTISGTIIGPETHPTDVYGHMVVAAAARWPQLGDDLPVVYKPGKVDSTWSFGQLQPPKELF